ncbi:hypothetical protein [Rhizobacter sp. P5_C2]
MPEISIQTMVFAIEAIAGQIDELQQTLGDGDAVPEDYQRMDDLRGAARELEREYDKAAKTVLNLPPYDELVKR